MANKRDIECHSWPVDATLRARIALLLLTFIKLFMYTSCVFVQSARVDIQALFDNVANMHKSIWIYCVYVNWQGHVLLAVCMARMLIFWDNTSIFIVYLFGAFIRFKRIQNTIKCTMWLIDKPMVTTDVLTDSMTIIELIVLIILIYTSFTLVHVSL